MSVIYRSVRMKKIIAVTDFADGAVHFYEMDKEGKIGAFIQRLEFKGSSISYRQNRAHPHSAFLQQTVSIVMWQILDLIRCGY